MEMADEFWRYERARTCAAEFILGRKNVLGRNLLLPDCLGFMRGDSVSRLASMRDNESVTCAAPAPAPRSGSGGQPSLE